MNETVRRVAPAKAASAHADSANGLRGLAILLMCQSGGEFISHMGALPLPGPVVGMLLLLVLLNVPGVRAPVSSAASMLLTHLSLLFIPVGVGVMSHLDLLERYGARLALILVLSTWVGLAVTALVMRALWRDD